MLYRMKRNAAGLANICIISTMVMVMISGTLSLYAGTEGMIDELYPHDFSAKAVYFFTEPWTLASRRSGRPSTTRRWTRSSWTGTRSTARSRATPRRWSTCTSPRATWRRRATTAWYLLTAASYALLTGNEAPVLGEGEALARFPAGTEGRERVVLSSEVKESAEGGYVHREAAFDIVGGADISVTDIERSVSISDERDLILVVSDTQSLLDTGFALQRGGYNWEGLYDFDGLTYSEQIALDDAYWDTENGGWLAAADDVSGYYSYMTTDIRADFASDSYLLTGGFLFLGIFLGAVFLMAMVLIMYYKQVSEGYEDQRRFVIMRQVGLSEQETRRAIHRPDTDGVLPAHHRRGGAHRLRLQPGGAAPQPVPAGGRAPHRALHPRHAGRVLRRVRHHLPHHCPQLFKDRSIRRQGGYTVSGQRPRVFACGLVYGGVCRNL